MKTHAQKSYGKPLCGAHGTFAVFLAEPEKGQQVDCKRCMNIIRAMEMPPKTRMRPMAGNRRFTGRWQ